MKKFFIKTKNFVKKYVTIFVVIFIFLFLFICDLSPRGNFIVDNLRSIATTFTPTTDLFDDGSEVSFVNYFFGMNFNKQNKKAEFYLPCSYDNQSSSDDFLLYTYDGIVRSVSSGVVSAVGYTTNNEKYIEIEHYEGYKSRYVGLSIIGITAGDYVNHQNPIGISSSDKSIRIYIHKDENLVKVSEIDWKS